MQEPLLSNNPIKTEYFRVFSIVNGLYTASVFFIRGEATG